MYYLTAETLRVGREHGLVSIASLLVLLALMDGRRMMSRLAEACGIHVAVCTSTVERLESAGVVVRVHGEEDLRTVYAEITAKGWETVARAIQGTLQEVAL